MPVRGPRPATSESIADIDLDLAVAEQRFHQLEQRFTQIQQDNVRLQQQYQIQLDKSTRLGTYHNAWRQASISITERSLAGSPQSKRRSSSRRRPTPRSSLPIARRAR